MEKKRKLKHKWVKRFELSTIEIGENYSVCQRCGAIMKRDGSNKDAKRCPGNVKITMRERATKKPKA